MIVRIYPTGSPDIIEAVNNLNTSRVQPYISRLALLSDELSESNSQLKNLLGLSSLVVSYQGSNRVDRWHLNHHSVLRDQSTMTGQVLVSVRNLSTSGHAFSLFGHEHRQWQKDRGWSEPLMSSWIPIAGEILVWLPVSETGSYRLGALNQPKLQIEVQFD